MGRLSSGFRSVATGLLCLALVGCTTPEDVNSKPEPLGDFKLGYAIVVAKNVKKGPLSREASIEMLETAIKPELEKLFQPYEGSKFYHLGISVDAYVLAVPGVPIVASPKSALILGLTVWDDASSTKLNDPPEQIIVLEEFSTKSILGSGLTQSKEEQLAGLSKAAAKQIQTWMIKNRHLFEKAEQEEEEL